MTNFYQVKKTINGVEYTAQFNGLGFSADVIDQTYIPETSNTSLVLLFDKLLSHVIVEPKLSIDDFGSDILGKSETRVINGIEYTAKFKGIRTALRAIDETYINSSSNTSVKMLNEFILENIIVTPANLTMDSFDTIDELNEVISFGREVMHGWGLLKEVNELMTFAREVMQGKFCKSVKPSQARTGSKK